MDNLDIIGISYINDTLLAYATSDKTFDHTMIAEYFGRLVNKMNEITEFKKLICIIANSLNEIQRIIVAETIFQTIETFELRDLIGKLKNNPVRKGTLPCFRIECDTYEITHAKIPISAVLDDIQVCNKICDKIIEGSEEIPISFVTIEYE